MLGTPAAAAGQQRENVAAVAPAAGRSAAPPPAATTSIVLPPRYVIGPQDVLSVVFWRDKDLSADVVVRPDGKISLPLLNEMQAAGYSPEQLRTILTEAAGKFVEDPTVTVVVKEIHSRNVYITGNVAKPGTFPLTNDMTVLQLIALAGGLQEYSDAKNIVVIRTQHGRQQYHRFNYKDVIAQRRTEQNLLLEPGDTVVVP
jgi:polysaccharide export outer membrane protein